MLEDHDYPVEEIERVVADLEPRVGCFARRQRLDAARYLNPDFLLREPKLSTSRWRGYHGWTPVRLNLEFCNDYRAAYRDYIRQHVDREIADKVSGINVCAAHFPKDDPRDRAERTAITRVRMMADAFGLPYKPFISFCMGFAERRGVEHVTRPGQLIPSLRPPRHAARRAKWSPDRIKQRHDQWLQAVKRFRRDWFSTMPGGYYDTPAPNPNIAPGCFGILGARDDGSPICKGCPFLDRCRAECCAIESELAAIAMKEGKPQTFMDKEAEFDKRRKAKAAAHMRDIRAKRRESTRGVH